MPLDELRRVRLEKLKALKKAGIDPFPSKFERKLSIARVREAKLGSQVQTAGRITAWRSHGGLVFADIFAENSKIQVLFREDQLAKKDWETLSLLDIGDFLGVWGEFFKTETGELTIRASGYSLLTKSLRPFPSKSGLNNVEERYRQRYVDLLVNYEVRQVFETRTKIINALRSYLVKNGAFEVETPILQPLYGGASARPFVTHHNALNADFYLRISDELYLKRLIVGGFDFVFEFGKDFRNEGIDRQHNPEFTMLEFYWAWKDYQDLMQFTQEMISYVVKEVIGGLKVIYEGDVIDFTTPWKRVTFREAVLKESNLDVGKFDTEEKLVKEIKKRKIPLDLKGVAGYGAVLDAFYKQLVRPNILGPLIIYDWPVEMVPLAKRKASNPKLVESFQPLVKGMELLLAYSELNDPLDQRARWEEEMKLARKGLEEHQVLDEDYIRALEYGMPPTAGWGMGIDRFAAILTDQHSIKDTILFPTLRPEK